MLLVFWILTQMAWITRNATFGITILQYFSRMEYKTCMSRSHAVINLLTQFYYQMVKINSKKIYFKGFQMWYFIPQVSSILLQLSSPPTEYSAITLTRQSPNQFYWGWFYNFIWNLRESLFSEYVQQLIGWFDVCHQQCNSSPPIFNDRYRDTSYSREQSFIRGQ